MSDLITLVVSLPEGVTEDALRACLDLFKKVTVVSGDGFTHGMQEFTVQCNLEETVHEQPD